MKTDILAIGVHPDDVELSCSGTLAKEIKAGKTACILDLTRGELGTRGDAQTRTQEAMAAAKLLGVKERMQMEMRDGFFINDDKHQMELISRIRYFRPDVVLCNAVTDRHPDHGRAAKMVADACFYSGLSKIKTLMNGEPQEAWRPRAVYHYIQDNYIHPDFVVDVTEFADLKHKAIMAFESQFYKPGTTEPETPISSKEFLEGLFSKMALWGRFIGVKYAEGFTVARCPGVHSVFDLI